MKLLQTINEQSNLITYQDLEVGKSYKFKDEIGQWFKGTVTSIKPLKGSGVDVNYTYDDDSYSKKGKSDTFEVGKEDKVFKKLDERYDPDDLRDVLNMCEEALEAGIYAIEHPDSNQSFALRAMEDALHYVQKLRRR